MPFQLRKTQRVIHFGGLLELLPRNQPNLGAASDLFVNQIERERFAQTTCANDDDLFARRPTLLSPRGIVGDGIE